MNIIGAEQDLISTPLESTGARGSDPLDVAQRAITIGEVIPVVFARRAGTVGGVLISPGASEARFENSATNEVTAYYRLVIGEGRMAPVQLRDLFQRSCRVGVLQQTYDRSAGTWTPGNFIVERAGYKKPECPYFCGTGGSYDGLTTGSFVVTAPDGDTRWDRQVHLFIRDGIEVSRLIDGFTGPTNNFADVALWVHRATNRAPAELIDVDAYRNAARFTEAMGFTFDCRIDKSTNFEDFIAEYGKYFMLTKAKRSGRVGLRPALPITAGNTVSTDPVTAKFLFNEDQFFLESFDIAYTPLADRKPFCAVMLWRQQPEDGIGLVRSTEVRYSGTALTGPYEQHDLSAFATSELHAVRAGAWVIARRRRISHTLRIKAKPHSGSQALTRGDIVQVQLARVTSSAAPGEHNYFYEIDRISKARNGELAFELTHFPVDDQGRSLVALDVMAATASGVMLPTGFNAATISCDVNSASDTTLAPDVGFDGPNYDAVGVGGWGGGGGGGGEDTPPDAPVAPNDPLDSPVNRTPEIAEEARVGDVLTAPDCECETSSTQWYRGTAFGDNPTPIPSATGGTYKVGVIDAGMGIFAVITCTDGSACTTKPVQIISLPSTLGALSINGVDGVIKNTFWPFTVTQTPDVSGTNYAWSIAPSGATIIGAGASASVSVPDSNDYTITVTATKSGATNSPRTKTWDIYALNLLYQIRFTRPNAGTIQAQIAYRGSMRYPVPPSFLPSNLSWEWTAVSTAGNAPSVSVSIFGIGPTASFSITDPTGEFPALVTLTVRAGGVAIAYDQGYFGVLN